MVDLPLELGSGRPIASRRDSRQTRRRLVDGAGTYAATHGRPPARLADVARHAGVSTATAYRYFASLDDLASAHLARLPERAVEIASRRDARRSAHDDPAASLLAWNRAWVAACVEHAETAVPLRSTVGFMKRRADGDPLVTFVCRQVEPLLAAAGLPVEVALAVWNVVSDPREVVDLRETLGWSPSRIARHITRMTLAASAR